MDEQTKHLLDWSQWGSQWIEHLRKSKPLGRELERHLHKFEETFTQIGRKASLLDANKNEEEPVALELDGLVTYQASYRAGADESEGNFGIGITAGEELVELANEA